MLNLYFWSNGDNQPVITIKVALAVGKNHNVLLMIIRVLVSSVATASDASPTSGLGSTFGSALQSETSPSYLKLFLCFFFLPNSCPHTKFHPNRTKNIEVKKICYRSALVGPVCRKMAVSISN